MHLETPVVPLSKTPQEIYTFITNLANFKKLLPNNITTFEVNEDSFVFGLSGMPEIKLVVKEKLPHHQLVLGAASSKLDFSLTAKILPIDAQNSTLQLFFKGNFNPMMAMMVKKPLTNFMQTLGDNLHLI